MLLINQDEHIQNQIVELNADNGVGNINKASLGLLQQSNQPADKKMLIDLGFKNGSTLAIVHNQSMKSLSQREQVKIKQ